MEASKRGPGGRWQPGQSGNPAGRASGKVVTEIMAKIGQEAYQSGPDSINRLENLCRSLFDLASATYERSKDRMEAARMVLAYLQPVPRDHDASAASGTVPGPVRLWTLGVEQDEEIEN